MPRGQLAWSPDGTRIAVSHDALQVSVFAIHDTTTGQAVVTLGLPSAATGTSPATATAVTYSPDGRRVAALVSTGSTSADRELKVWDAATGKEVLAVRRPPTGSRPIKLNGRLGDDCQLTFNGDGHRLIAWEVGVKLDRASDGKAGVPAFILTTWDASPVPNRTLR